MQLKTDKGSIAFRLRCLVCVALLTIVQTGIGQTVRSPETALPDCLVKANALLDEAFNFMQKNYYRRSSIAWDSLLSSAKSQLIRSGNCDETYSIIAGCFRSLNETHSFIMPPARAEKYSHYAALPGQPPVLSDLAGDIKGELLDNGIAYLTVPWVNTTDSVICTQIADSIQQLIAALDGSGTSSWIIDLRKNTGGNCWPMLAGIGPLLGDGICGYFVSANEKIPISYNNGAASQGKHVRCRVSNNGYKTKLDKKMIVVLTGRRTVSSGEIIALAFKGKAQVYLYGEPTAGFTTANATYNLADHSMLVLTVCMEADRNGKICEGSILPDQHIVNENGPGARDAAKAAALMWLSAQ